MNDFICDINFAVHKNVLGKNVDYTPNTGSFISPTYFSPSHINFVPDVSEIQEPKTYLEARNNPEWLKAMGKEIRALELNNTWEICELPKGKKPSVTLGI